MLVEDSKKELSLVWRRGLSVLTDYFVAILCYVLLAVLLALPHTDNLQQAGTPIVIMTLMMGFPVMVLLQLSCLLLTGKTVGKWLWKLQVINSDNGEPIRRTYALVRETIACVTFMWFGLITVPVNAIMVIRDKARHLSLTDRVFKTQVIKA